MKLSCVIPVAADNCRWMERAVTSAVPWFQEIIVVCDRQVKLSPEIYESKVITHTITVDHPDIARQENLGIAASTGDYVSCLDSDDWFIDDGIARLVGHLRRFHAERIPNLVVYGRVIEYDQLEDPNRLQINHTWPDHHISPELACPPCASLFDRRLWYRVEGLESVRYEDWHFWKKLEIAGADFRFFDEDFYGHRRWPGSVSAKMNYRSDLGH